MSDTPRNIPTTHSQEAHIPHKLVLKSAHLTAGRARVHFLKARTFPVEKRAVLPSIRARFLKCLKCFSTFSVYQTNFCLCVYEKEKERFSWNLLISHLNVRFDKLAQITCLFSLPPPLLSVWVMWANERFKWQKVHAKQICKTYTQPFQASLLKIYCPKYTPWASNRQNEGRTLLGHSYARFLTTDKRAFRTSS